MFAAVVLQHTGGLWTQVEQSANGAAGAAAGAQLQNLSQQHESSNCRRGLEVNIRTVPHGAEGCGKNLREQDRDQAVPVGHASAHGDQGEHICAAIHDRRPAALKKRPSAPEHNGSRQ